MHRDKFTLLEWLGEAFKIALILFVTLSVLFLGGCTTTEAQWPPTRGLPTTYDESVAYLATQPSDPQRQACREARTAGEAYGTPADRGPCWRFTVGQAHAGGVSSYTVSDGWGNYANVTYRGNTLVGFAD